MTDTPSKRPAPVSTGWQQRKSAQTRNAILEAAIECLERFGYARTTTQLIAQTARISRGAMLHHYATKQEMIVSLVDYIFHRRLERLAAGIKGLSEAERVHEQAGLEVYWQGLLSREFAAYLELLVASRTDTELAAIFLPRAQRYDATEREDVVKMFPEWQRAHDRYLAAMDFCIATNYGLLLNRDVWEDEARRRNLRRMLAHVVVMLRDGLIDPLGLPEG